MKNKVLIDCTNMVHSKVGGFETYLFNLLANSGKEIIGFDLVEVAPGENDDWDGNVGARMLFHMCGIFAKSQKLNLGNRIEF
jgi:agmatinase